MREPISAKASGKSLASASTRRAVFLTFVVATAALGGGARADIVSLVLLRPLAVLVAGYALVVMPRGQLQPFRPILLLAIAAAVAIGWQLVPLPPSVWQNLPGRAPIEGLDHLLGFGDPWRPASLSPGSSWNALFSLAVPVAALLGYASLEPEHRQTPAIIAIFGLTSALIGAFQTLGDGSGPFYFYRITNNGLPVGLFANRNHQAIVLGLALPILALAVRRSAARRTWVLLAGVIALGLMGLVMLLTGSRTGLLLGLPQVALAAWIFWKSRPAGRDPSPNKVNWATRGLAVGMLVIGCAAVAITARSAAFQRLSNSAVGEELRFRALPTVLGLVKEYFPFGSGPGSFALVYQKVEPTSLLQPAYLNQAHNDWVQPLIELGLPGLLLIAALLLVLAQSMMARLRRESTSHWYIRAALVAPFVALAGASLFEYPLRTPSIASLAVLWLAVMRDPHVTLGSLPAGLRQPRR